MMDIEAIKINKLIDRAINIMAKYVMPVYKTYKNKPQQIGTGFIVLSKGCYFFLSAGHVLEETKKNELFIYVEPNINMALTGKVRIAKDIRNIDVGVIKLEYGKTPPYPSVNKSAINISGLEPCSLPRSGKRLAIVGFPASKSKVNPVRKSVKVIPYGYHNNSIKDKEYESNDLSVEKHLAMKLDLKRGVGPNGSHRNFPKPSGMSGSPIWLIHDENNEDEYNKFPIVGIGIEYRKNEKLLVGTDIAYGIWLIESYS